jgi:hypothetical protein
MKRDSSDRHRFFRATLRRISGIVLLCAVWKAWPQEPSIAEDIQPAKTAVAAVKDSAAVRQPRLDLLAPVLRKKENTIMAGNALFFSGCLIQYALILPQGLKIKPNDIEDQLALISPSLLASGLRYAGTPMSCMRTSEALDAYRRITGGIGPKNYAWKLYFSGWGMTVVAGAANAAAVVVPMLGYDEKYGRLAANAATGIAIGADVVWAAANIYSYYFVKKLGVPAAAPRVGIAPVVGGRGSVGCAMSLRF